MTQQERQGWIIVASLFATMVLIFGSGYGTIPLFVPTLVKAFGWKRAEVSMLPSALAFSSGVTVLIAGWLVDRFEARFVIASGAVMAAIAFLIASSANSLTVMVGAYLLLGVAFSFGTVIPLSYVIANWFTRQRGLAMGISSAGSTAGAMVMTLVASFVIRHWGWRAASLDGFETAEAFRTRSFWMIVLAQFCFALAAAGAVIHMVAHLIDVGYVAGNAALIMSFTFGMMTVGKVSMGFLADRISARVALMFNFAGQALGLILALQVRHIIVLPLFVLFFGLTLAPPLMLIPLLIAESLGLRRYGALTGITSIAATIGSTLGPLVAGRVFDVTHSYTSAFELFIAINLIGALVTFASTSYEKERSRMSTSAVRSAALEAKPALKARVDLKAKA